MSTDSSQLFSSSMEQIESKIESIEPVQAIRRPAPDQRFAKRTPLTQEEVHEIAERGYQILRKQVSEKFAKEYKEKTEKRLKAL